MARAPRESTRAEGRPTPLPLSPSMIQHHGDALFGPMQEWIRAQRVPPVLLLTGVWGVGKRELGYFLAQWILCEKTGFIRPETDLNADGADLFGSLLGESADRGAAPRMTTAGENPGPCGECSACLRALHSNWVDFTEISPEEEDSSSGGALKIDQLRKLKASVGFGAHQGAYRIILIPNADRMTVQAANSVLKLLEEPPTGWVFLLTASDPTLVLPTVLSRCQRIRLRPFARKEIEELLGQHEPRLEKNQIAVCAELAQGSPGRALSLASEEIWKARQQILDFLAEPAAALTALLDWGATDNARFDLLVDQLEQLSADLVCWSAAGSLDNWSWRNSDATRILLKHGRGMIQKLGNADQARGFWQSRAERLAQARIERLAPLNRKILIQDLLLPWLEPRSLL